MKTKLLLMLAAAAALFALSATAGAADPCSITVLNFGFESRVFADDGYGGMNSGDSWGYFTIDGYGGIWRPLASAFGGGVPEGDNIGFADVYEGATGPGGLAQVLIDTFEPNQVYTLTVEVGNSGYYEWAGYIIQLVAGGTQAGGATEVTGGEVLAQDDNTLEVRSGKFLTSTTTYYPDGAHGHLAGLPLQIRLLGKIPLSGLNEPCFDWVRLTKEDATYLPVRDPSPSYGQELIPSTDVTLSWTNADSTDDPPGDVYVEVYWGTDPAGLTKIFPLSGKPAVASSVNVGVNPEGTYYWQVESWTEGTNNGPSDQTGAVWYYDIVDLPPSVEINTPDMNTWLDQGVPLAATVDDDGGSTINYLWTAEPADGVSFDDDTAIDPTVTITGLIGNPNTVTLTFAATDDKATATDTMTIDVYSDACAATRLAMALWPDTDITGDTCKTDLEDLALALAAWLDGSKLTTPIAKP